MKPEDYQEIIKRKDAGLITMRKHPILDLEICNYTPKTQYNKLWDVYTLMSRGLILDSEHNILSKPFSKFFNLNETAETTMSNLPAEIPSISEKLDGVLGILYPGSKIVVDYKGRSELVLLAVLNNENKHELAHVKEAEELGLSCAKEFHFDDLTQAEKYLAEMQGINHEGFVCRYLNGLRLKLKSEDYRKLHKILTGFSAKDVWDALRQGKTLDDLLNIVPDEFYQWVKRTEVELLQSKNKIIKDATAIYQEAGKLSSRKEQALYILKATDGKYKGLNGVVFSMLDCNMEKADEAAWKLIEPKADKVNMRDDA